MLRVAAALAVAGGVALGVRGVDGLAALGAAAATALVLGLFFRRWIGGVTGDTLGATTELRAGCGARGGAARLVTRVLLIRHAQPEDDARGRCYGRLDVGLSPAGEEAAERLARVFPRRSARCTRAHVVGRCRRLRGSASRAWTSV